MVIAKLGNAGMELRSIGPKDLKLKSKDLLLEPIIVGLYLQH